MLRLRTGFNKLSFLFETFFAKKAPHDLSHYGNTMSSVSIDRKTEGAQGIATGSGNTLGRWISLFELLLGSFVVLGHNVVHVLPNEVPILFALFWVSLRLRDGSLHPANLRRPASWIKTLLVAVAAAVALQLGSELIVAPLAARFTHTNQSVSSILKAPMHDWRWLLSTLALIWSFAAFGEEIGYRGYLLERAADLGNHAKAALVFALLVSAVLFGFGHFYKGPAGIIDSTYSGLILGGVYLLQKRNLWAPILAHGLSDTVAVVFLFMGWAT
jgi:membrane protease YdiL (CAAX protease family)